MGHHLVVDDARGAEPLQKDRDVERLAPLRLTAKKVSVPASSS